MNPLPKPCFIQYRSRKVVDSVGENLVGNAKEYHDTLIRSRYRIDRGSLIRIAENLIFRNPDLRSRLSPPRPFAN